MAKFKITKETTSGGLWLLGKDVEQEKLEKKNSQSL